MRGLTLVLGLGVAGVLGCAVLPQARAHLRRRDEYAEIDRLWLFAVLGTVLSLLQLLIYSVLARQGTRSVYFVWLALVAVLVVGSQASTLDGLLLSVVTIDRLLFLVLADISLRRLRSPVVGEEPPPEAVSEGAASVRRLVPAGPVPTDTSSGTARSRRRHLLAHQRLELLALARGDLEDELVVDLEQHPGPQARLGSAASTRSIATLIMSAADPWIGALSAIRSAISRRWRLSLVRSGR